MIRDGFHRAFSCELFCRQFVFDPYITCSGLRMLFASLLFVVFFTTSYRDIN
jgi:hypothetical protein